MNRTSASTVTLAAVVIAGVTLALGTATARQQNAAVDKDDLAGVVTSAKGPEATTAWPLHPMLALDPEGRDQFAR